MSSRPLDEVMSETPVEAIQSHCEPEETHLEPSKQPLVDKFERCSFCNTKLLFTHELNLSTFELVESNRCPGCGVTARPKKHTLQ